MIRYVVLIIYGTSKMPLFTSKATVLEISSTNLWHMATSW